jgi:hypothetical protein
VSIPASALPHLARRAATKRTGPKNVQGERQSLPDVGKWFPARIMVPRSSEDTAERGGRRRAETRYSLLYGDEYDDGTVLDRPPRKSDMIEVDVRGDVTTYQVAGVRPIDTGDDVLGGTVDLVEVEDSA